eukprot:Unigene2180_Nuclearia_a/m.6778 Unigene2180_Nuclearia_a/g.6778  ORF Unigene2180_Nuclearia_a/g.6778 Unigene2180_Nuclearia_a/m.6778 type:complete len:360 (+) Unigene2180_Nuclearia_a:89-1168(+)
MRAQLLNPAGGVPFCDWRVTVVGCVDGDWFRTVWLVGASLAIATVVLLAPGLVDRMSTTGARFFNSKGQPNGIEVASLQLIFGSAFFAVHAFLVAFDAYTSHVQREVMFILPYTLYFLAFVTFIHASFRALPGDGELLATDEHEAFWMRRPGSIQLHVRLWIVSMALVPAFFLAMAAAIGAAHDRGMSDTETSLYLALYNCVAISMLALFLSQVWAGAGLVRIIRKKVIVKHLPTNNRMMLLIININLLWLPLSMIAFALFVFLSADYYDFYSNVPGAKTLSVLELVTPSSLGVFVSALYWVLRFYGALRVHTSGVSGTDDKNTTSQPKSSFAGVGLASTDNAHGQSLELSVVDHADEA